MSSVLSGALSAQGAPAPTFTVEETSLGTSTGYDSIRGAAASPDGKHIIFLGVKGKQQFVVIDGKPGPAFEWIIPESVAYNEGHVGYLVQTSTETQPVVDDQVGKGFYTVNHNHMFWSPDAKRVAIAVRYQDGGGAVAVDGVAGPKFDNADEPAFSPDSKRLAYVAQRGRQKFVVIDGEEQKGYEEVGRLTFGPDSRHLSYIAVSNGKYLLVLSAERKDRMPGESTWTQTEGKPYDSVKLGPAFTTDGARLVAVVAQGNNLNVVVNGRESEPYEKIVLGDFVLSPDGKRLACAVKKGDKQVAMIDDVAQSPFDHINAYTVSFSPDSKHVCYAAATAASGPEFVVLDGVQQKPVDGVIATPIFSPDSKRLAFPAKVKSSWCFVVDGVQAKTYDVIEPPGTQIFSPDSQRVAYRAAIGKTGVAVVDGVESPPADYVDPISFSADSKHVANLCVRDGKTLLIIDGVQAAGPFLQSAPDTRVFFDSNTAAHFIAMKKDEFVKVTVKIQ